MRGATIRAGLHPFPRRRPPAALTGPVRSKVAGLFITFEGLDGCGKTTQLNLLAAWFASHHETVVTTREPGGTPLGRRLRAALLEIEGKVDPLAELLLFTADRAQHVNTLIRPALARGQSVLSDRYTDSTRAYQGAGRRFDAALIDSLMALATHGLQPDVTFLLDVPVEISLARLAARTDAPPDRLDSEHADFRQRVREAYLTLAAAAPHRVHVLDARAGVAELHAQIVAYLLCQYPKR